MAKRSLVSTMNAIAREQAKQQRKREAEEKHREREKIKQAREAARANAIQAKEDKQRYLEARIEETSDLNSELKERVGEFHQILELTLTINDSISFESLRILDVYSPLPVPKELSTPTHEPDKSTFYSKVKAPSFLENALGMKKRYQRELQTAEELYHRACKLHEETENERQRKLEEFLAREEIARKAYYEKAKQRNLEVNELEKAYLEGDISAVITYNTMVLERSEYPDGFPQQFRLAYDPGSKEIVIEYELPDVTVIPTVGEYKYSKTKDEIEEKPRKPAEIKELYQDIIASVTLRTIHEVLEADQCNHLEVVTFSGFVDSIDPATGKNVRPCVISVRTVREKFQEINLARIDKRICLRNLGAQVSPQPQALQAVKPVVEFDMVDKRFVEQADMLSELESRPNLMELSPAEFETLVSNLFEKMRLDTKLTRASRDGGVDAVAFDTRPVLGGKVVIQAKRYKNTVGVSAVRDLYGTMLNEGASKGIIVATSSYGPDAYDFAKDKPLELIDGGGLLYLLDRVGIKARIVFPDEG